MSSRHYVGRAIAALEDERLVTGSGSYVDDVKLENVHALALVRSQYARAVIKRIDVSDAAKKAALVITYGDIKGRYGDALVPADPLPGATITKMPPLADGKVNFVGQPVVAVVGRDRYEAEDLAELVTVDYDPLSAVVDPEKAIEPGAPVIHESLGSNFCVNKAVGSGDVESAFKGADVIVRDELHVHRIASNPIEPRGIIVSYDDGGFTVRVSCQSLSRMRDGLSEVLGVPKEKIRVLQPNVGGAFGSKSAVYPEYVSAAYSSQLLKRPIKWIETRREHLVATYQGRDIRGKLQLAADSKGTMLAVRGSIIGDIGAYNLFVNAGNAPFVASQILGQYRIQAANLQVMSVFTNKTPIGPYRGYGRPDAAFLTERMVDLLADRLSIDPVEIRKRNLIRVDEMPYKTPLGLTLDREDYHAILNRALRLFHYRTVKRSVERARRTGRLVGLGIADFIDANRLAPGESASLRVETDGRVTLVTGLVPQGQDHVTILSQLVADELGLRFEDVNVIHGDSKIVSIGIGTFGSRSAAVGGEAAVQAARGLIGKMLEAASKILGCPTERLEYKTGMIKIKGKAGEGIRLRELASKVGPLEYQTFHKANDIFSFGCHMAMVETDEDTGKITILDYRAVDDAGRVINPLLADAQISGGIMQGLGQLLYEDMIHDENGQPLIGSIGDAGVPSAMESIEPHSELYEYPSALLSGVRGIGESGTVGSLPAVSRAIENAIGARINVTRLKPHMVWELLRAKRERK